MSWVENHKVSSRLAAEAEAAVHGGREDEAACLYAKAADAEDKALADLDPSNGRTLGITTVSTVSLRLKAARCVRKDISRADRFAKAEEVAQAWLARDELPAFAEDQLRALLLAIPIGGNMRQYLNRVHEQAEEQGRPVSELLFEDYCTRAGIQWERIREQHGKTLDYELVVDDQMIIAEVKEITKNKAERESDQLLRERGYGEALRGKPGARVRKKIMDSSPQIKARTAGRHPGFLVLYDDGRIAGHLDRYHIMTAMYGLEVVHVTVPQDPSARPYATGGSFGPNKKMTNNTTTSISAIGALVVTAPDGVIELHVYHNLFAAVPIDPALLARRGIQQCRIDLDNRRWVELRQINGLRPSQQNRILCP
ncbi:MAG: hypothetical protein OXQ29_05320 [Rhodospirillaceae bacterium]|nr:hypothetical protein [Rhodospirillaceae bacterium]